MLRSPDKSRSQEWYESIDGALRNSKYNRMLSVKDYEVKTCGINAKSSDTFSIQRCLLEDGTSGGS